MNDTIHWNIYYASSDFARINGDPLLGTVSAPSRERAEMKAECLGLGMPGFGCRAVRSAADPSYPPVPSVAATSAL